LPGSSNPNGDIVGHSIKVSALQSSPPDWLTAPGADEWMQVIGVVGDSLKPFPQLRTYAL
jgi:hypothetical protein